MAALKVYADRISQPSRAVVLFCKVSGVEFEEVPIDLFKAEHCTPDFEEVNPCKLVPAISHGDFNLNESHAILIYIASAFPTVAEHWYPTDCKLKSYQYDKGSSIKPLVTNNIPVDILIERTRMMRSDPIDCKHRKRGKLHSLLDWHHTNLRRGAMGYLLHTVLAPIFNTPDNPVGKAECEKTLLASLSTMESVWLKGNGGFLLGATKPSIADLCLVSEIMQLQLLDEKEQARLVGPYKKVEKWIQDVKNATKPHFEDVHQKLFDVMATMNKAAN